MTEINYDELAEAPVAVSDEELQSIAKLAERQIILEDWIEQQEARIAEAKKNLRKVTGELLPEALRSAGVKEFTLENGAKLNLNSKVRANITEANKEWCHEWLRDHGGGEIIRNKFELTFGKDDDARAVEFADLLLERELDFSQKESIPWNSLDAYVRAEMAENEHGEDWENKFGVYRDTFVKIERPK